MLTTLIDYGGRLHPLLVHFPIAFLLAGAAIEVARWRRDGAALGALERWAVGIGAAGAVLAAFTGWLFAYQVHRPPELRPILLWHRWLGVALAGVSILAAWAAYRWAETTSPRARWARGLLVGASGVLLVVVGHLGAALVWGTDFFAPPGFAE
jgi:uncharacterized membrane protein